MLDSEGKIIVGMPAGHELGRAELCEMHIHPGAWVPKGAAVVSVLTETGRLTMRSDTAGVIIPLLSEGDPVAEGDALFTLRPGPKNGSSRRLPDEGAPGMARRRLPAPLLKLRDFTRKWAWPILGIALYLSFARWVLPRLDVWLPELTHWHWLAVLIGLLAAGFVGFHALGLRGGVRGYVIGRSLIVAWVLLVSSGIYLQAGGVRPLVDDVVTGSRTVATHLATATLGAVPDARVTEEAQQSQAALAAPPKPAIDRETLLNSDKVIFRSKSRLRATQRKTAEVVSASETDSDEPAVTPSLDRTSGE
ncbi:MAG: hypothetical protein AAGE80_06255 [Pseudomonadota bacterium]